MAALALFLLGCDADEGRDPARPSLALTAAMETTTSGGGDETTSTSTSTTSTTSTSTSTTSSTSSGGFDESTSSESTSTTDDGSSSGGDTTGEGLTTSTTSTTTTTGEQPPCPCTPEVLGGQNLCAQEPTPDCPATLPGGICDPNGDGSFADGDWIAGYHGYLAACA